MSAFADYIDLRLAVSEHVGNRAISDVFSRLVQQAEADLNRKLRTRKQMTEATLTFTGGVATLPADCLQIISLFYSAGVPMYAGSVKDGQSPRSQDFTYAVFGNTVRINGFEGAKQLLYFAKIPTLTTSLTTTNWLLEDHPNVYLYSVGFEAAKFLRDAELAQATAPLMVDAINDVIIDDEAARWSNSVVRLGGVAR